MDGAEFSVDQEVHATAGREAGATSSRSIGGVQVFGNLLYTYRKTALVGSIYGQINRKKASRKRLALSFAARPALIRD